MRSPCARLASNSNSGANFGLAEHAVTLRLNVRMRQFAPVASTNLRISRCNIINYAAIMIMLRGPLN